MRTLAALYAALAALAAGWLFAPPGRPLRLVAAATVVVGAAALARQYRLSARPDEGPDPQNCGS